MGVGTAEDFTEEEGTTETDVGPEHRLTRDFLENLYPR
jgi:hypothetical protein